jgi:hypothetical protein
MIALAQMERPQSVLAEQPFSLNGSPTLLEVSQWGVVSGAEDAVQSNFAEWVLGANGRFSLVADPHHVRLRAGN